MERNTSGTKILPKEEAELAKDFIGEERRELNVEAENNQREDENGNREKEKEEINETTETTNAAELQGGNSSDQENNSKVGKTKMEVSEMDDLIASNFKTVSSTACPSNEKENAGSESWKAHRNVCSHTNHEGPSTANDIEMEDFNSVYKDEVTSTNSFKTATTLHDNENRTTDSDGSNNCHSIENEDISTFVRTKYASEGKENSKEDSKNSHESCSEHSGGWVAEQFSLPQTASNQLPGNLGDTRSYHCAYDNSKEDPLKIMRSVEDFQQEGNYSLACYWSEYGLECACRSQNYDLYMMFINNLMQLYLLMEEVETAIAVYESCVDKLVLVSDPKVIQSFVDIHALCLKRRDDRYPEVALDEEY